MSKAESIEKKLWKAYGKVAKTLGKYDFELYRSSVLNEPIQSGNFIDTQEVSFSKDDKYSGTDSSGVSKWLCWIDGRLTNLKDVGKGDYLYSQETGETYFIASSTDHLRIQAIKANGRLTITRGGSSGYGDNDGTGFAPGNVSADITIAEQVPCYILQPSSGGGTGGYIPAATQSTDALPRYEIYISDLNGTVQIRDIVTDQNGNQSQVLAIYTDDLGTKLVTQAQSS